MSEPDFPESEFAARTERAQRAMQAHGLDALFLTSEAEIRYFTGFRTLFWQSPTRPWFLIVPGSGKPVAIIPQIGAQLMAATWIDDRRLFASPHPDKEELRLLEEALAPFARVGMPMGPESMLRMPLEDFLALKARLTSLTFADASGLLQALRLVKSEPEIALIRESCTFASRAFAEAPNLFHEGQTLKDAFRAFRIELLTQGADDVPYLVGGAGAGGYGDVISPPTDQTLAEGDVFMLDTGATKSGYFCDFDRNFALGRASPEVRSAHERLVNAVTAAAAIARPGKTCADLYHAMADSLGAGGGDVGRFGHGVGLQLTEGPSLTPFDQTELCENMVLTLEPSLTLGPGKMMVHEENIVLRDGPPDFLSERTGPEIPVI